MKIREVVVTGQNQVELQTAEIDTPVLASNGDADRHRIHLYQ